MAGGCALPLGPSKQRTLLAALVFDAGHPVTAETLIDRVWDDAPPAAARSGLHSNVARVRRVLEQACAAGGHQVSLERWSGGYRLVVDPDNIDLHRFRRLVERARGSGQADPVRAALLREAIGLWRGEPLTGLSGDWAVRVREGLEQQRLGALIEWLDAELALGHDEMVIEEARQQLVGYPLAEPLVVRLMRALARAGREAEALDCYAKARRRIVEELGTEPGPELRTLHAALLRPRPPGRSAPTVHTAPVGTSGTGTGSGAGSVAAALCQLPPDLPDYTGYDDKVATASAALTDAGSGSAPPFVVISGQGGVGKTALAVHVAHQLRPAFPDGQLFIGLGGGRSRPVEPAEALGRALRALGVSDANLRPDIEERIAQYRAALDGKRILVVLDDAAGARQVRPFLLGGPGRAVIVSTRARLTAVPGACHVDLDVMAEEEAAALLERMVGRSRVRAEPEAAATLIRTCARLPLALRIAGARLAARPHWTVSRLAERMRDARRRLDELSLDDLEVRASLAVSYQGLTTEARRAFRALGFLDPPDFTFWTAAALLGTDLGAAEDLVEQLVDARLVEVVVADAPDTRFRMHDLVRPYAGERAEEEDQATDLQTAVLRLLTGVLRLVDQLGAQLPYAVPRLYRPALPAVTLDPSLLAAAERDLQEWFDAEEPSLVAAVERAGALGLGELACVLADALVFASFAKRNNFDGWNRAHTAALAAARVAGHRRAEAIIECGIGQLRYKEDRFAESKRHFGRAIELFLEGGDEHGEVTAVNGLATVSRELGEHTEALPLAKRARDALARLGDTEGVAHAEYGIGYTYRELGADDLALDHLAVAVDLYQAIGHRRGEAISIRGIGLVHRAAGALAAAAENFERAHEICGEIGDRLLLCYTGQALAKVWLRQGHPERGRPILEAALGTCTAMQDRLGVALVRRTLGELHLVTGDQAEALRQLGLAEAAWREMGLDLWRARTLRDIGAAYALGGACTSAHRSWQEAALVFARLGTRERAELPTWRRRWGCDCDLEAPTSDSVAPAATP